MVATLTIDVSEAGLDRDIFRVVPVARLVGAIRTATTSVVSTVLWDDPFENELIDKFADEVPIESLNRRRALFGQCWTWTPESDAMWRIYSPSKNGVRISSIPRRILEFASAREELEGTLAVAAITYMERRRAKSTIKANLLSGSTDDSILRSAAIKRVEFAHESELRLLYLPRVVIHQPVLQLKSRFHKLCQSIMFDPRMSDDEIYVYERFFRRHHFSRPIVRSKLYAV
jgi:hypothetical protein